MLRSSIVITASVFWLCLFNFFALSQVSTPRVYSATSRGQLPYAWAGGMNACQFGQIDIDRNGVKDLIVFDRCGNRIMPFVAVSGRYEYAPEYAANFPPLEEWVIFADYDGDGREDIFTYSPGYASMKVYRNTSGSSLEFTLEVFPYLTSFQGGGYVNILVTYADYPAIADLDGDGDLDILTFYGLGSFVEMHRNMSMEKYGTRDSLDYVKMESCWGRFAESEESNEITLDTCFRMVPGSGFQVPGSGFQVPGSGFQVLVGEERHTGSTFCVVDADGNDLPDILLGDVDYPGLAALFNNGSAEVALITSYEMNFPADDVPVSLFSMPLAYLLGNTDLLVSPFDPNPLISDNYNSCWYYRNTSTGNAPVYQLQNRRYLQEDMIDVGAGAYPVLADFDQDGLTDLFVGNHGRYDTSYYDQNLILHSVHSGKIALFRNSGSPDNPAFDFVTDDFANASQKETTGIIPAFADLDNDGDLDMITGREDGTLDRYENTANPGEPMDMAFREGNFQQIDVGNNSAPVFFDLDDDDVPELVIGEKGGNLNYFENTGTPSSPVFVLETDSLGKVNVTNYDVSLSGCSVPCFARDALGHVQLLVGSEQGKIFWFADIENDLTGQFKESGDPGSLLGLSGFDPDRGYRSAPCLQEINSDGVFDLIAGNFSGGLEFFSTYNAPQVYDVDEPGDPYISVRAYPNPTADEVHIGPLPASDVDRVKIADITGQEFQVPYDIENNSVRLNLNIYPDGLYFIQIILERPGGSDAVIIHKKVLKKTKYK